MHPSCNWSLKAQNISLIMCACVNTLTDSGYFQNFSNKAPWENIKFIKILKKENNILEIVFLYYFKTLIKILWLWKIKIAINISKLKEKYLISTY